MGQHTCGKRRNPPSVGTSTRSLRTARRGDVPQVQPVQQASCTTSAASFCPTAASPAPEALMASPAPAVGGSSSAISSEQTMLSVPLLSAACCPSLAAPAPGLRDFAPHAVNALAAAVAPAADPCGAAYSCGAAPSLAAPALGLRESALHAPCAASNFSASNFSCAAAGGAVYFEPPASAHASCNSSSGQVSVRCHCCPSHAALLSCSLRSARQLSHPLQAADGSPNANAIAATEFGEFRRLLSRARAGEQEDSSGRRVQYIYTLELQDNELRHCDERALSRLSLKAASGEPSWRCESCNVAGWSQTRACICVSCGADSPVDAAIMTQLKHAKRVEMAHHQARWYVVRAFQFI